jgi:hypothetical protein
MLECQGCHRYIHATESSCPFCATPLVLTSAVSPARGPMVEFAAGLSLLACTDSNDDSGETNAVTTDPSTSSESDSTSSSESDSTSTAGDGDGDTTVGDGDGDTLDYGGSDYGGSPPCDELANAIPVNVGSNPVDTTMSSNYFVSYCGDQMGTGPDQMLEFLAPADGQFTFAITGANFDAWLLQSGYYCGLYYGTGECMPNQALDIDLVEGQILYLILDGPTDGGGTASIDVTQG